METKKKRLTLDLDPTFQRRLKAIAALKGVSMRGYCQAAIDRELTRDEANGMAGLLSDKPDHELFAELRQEIFGGKPLPGNSADLIREAREIREAETEGWGVSGSVVVDASLAVKWLVEEDDSDKAPRRPPVLGCPGHNPHRPTPHALRGCQRSPPACVARGTERRRQYPNDHTAAWVPARTTPTAGPPRQSTATRKSTQAGCRLRRPLLGAGGEFRLRAVDR